MLTLRGLRARGLDPATLQIAPGECVSVAGPSGSGKTLLLRAVADLDPSEGEAVLDGRDRTAMAAPEWRRLVGYVAAEAGWWGDLVRDHFEGAAAGDLVESLGLPREALDWPVARLSTGERQRLAIARALARGPRVLLLDEPTSALDRAATDRVEAVLRERLAAGVAILLVTHDRAQARRLAGRRMRMSRGRLREAGP